MQPTHELKILFATRFTAECVETGRTIARLANSCQIGLTIAHVVGTGEATTGKRRQMDTFLAGEPLFEDARRLLIESEDPVVALSHLCEEERFDLVLAPAAHGFRLSRLFGASTRARLLGACPAPLWTAGPAAIRNARTGSLRTVACVVDLDEPNDRFLGLVSAFASRYEAKLQVLHVIPPVDEGTLAQAVTSSAPLMPEVAMDRIRDLFAGNAFPSIDVAIGETAKELPKMLERCDADLLFAGPGQALRGVFRKKLAPHIDKLACPVVCVDGAASGFRRWSFQDVPRFATTRPAAAPEIVVRSRPLAAAVRR